MTIPDAPPLRLHRYAQFVAFATLLLIFAGGLVTSTGSGLAVPDWPLSFGQVFPRMEGGVLYEHGHRMIAAIVGLLTIGLAWALHRWEPRRWVRRLGLAAVAAVIVQGTLGGLTVLFLLPDGISIAHAGLAQIFFCLTVAIALVTSPSWFEDQTPADGAIAATRTLTLAAVVALYTQILLGALVRHTGAGLVIPDFPLAYGRAWPRIVNHLVGIQMAHRVGALVAATVVVVAVVHVIRRHGADARLRRPALLMFALLGWQLLLGAVTIWSRKAVVPTTAHVASGALLLATALVLALRAQRRNSGDRTSGDRKGISDLRSPIPDPRL